MNPIQNMEKHKDEFTQNDLKIYNAILEQPERVISMTTSSFARSLDISQPALTRFIKMLGYERYKDFRSDMTKWSASLNSISINGSLPYFDRLRFLLQETEKILTDETLEDLSRYVLSFKRIFAGGLGKSREPAELLHSLLRKYGLFVPVVPLDELGETADNLSENDLLVLFSVSQNEELMEKVRNTEGKILLITANGSGKYSSSVDRMVLLPYLPPDPETSSISPVLFSIFVELLESYIGKNLLGKDD